MFVSLRAVTLSSFVALLARRFVRNALAGIISAFEALVWPMFFLRAATAFVGRTLVKAAWMLRL